MKTKILFLLPFTALIACNGFEPKPETTPTENTTENTTEKNTVLFQIASSMSILQILEISPFQQ